MKISKRLNLLLPLFLGLAALGLGAQQPAAPRESPALTFLVLSDWGRKGIKDVDKKAPGQVKVARQLAVTAKASGASFLLTCGDNFHGKGVPSLQDPLWAENFEKVYADPALAMPWYVALGNHDYEGNVEAELAYARTHPHWVQPARYYSFNKALQDGTTVLFVVLDSSPMVQAYRDDAQDAHHVGTQDAAAQTRWLKDVLAHSKADWTFVSFHHPVYSASSKHGSTTELQKAWMPLFEKYHVTACFSGHDHDLQHSHPAGGTLDYFGVGGGSDTRPVGKEAFTRFSLASLGFGVVRVTRTAARVEFVNDQGKTVYSYEMKK